MYLGMYVFQDQWTYVLSRTKPASTDLNKYRDPTDAELKVLGLQRYCGTCVEPKQPKQPKLKSSVHRFVTLPDGTEYDLEHIIGIGPVIVETKEDVENRSNNFLPPMDNTYLVEFENGKSQHWHNARVPREELVRLWKDIPHNESVDVAAKRLRDYLDGLENQEQGETK